MYCNCSRKKCEKQRLGLQIKQIAGIQCVQGVCQFLLTDREKKRDNTKWQVHDQFGLRQQSDTENEMQLENNMDFLGSRAVRLIVFRFRFPAIMKARH